MKVLVPVGETKKEEMKMAERPLDLRGKVLGLFWNHKPNGDLLLRNLGKALQSEFFLSGLLMKEKPNAASHAPVEMLEEIEAKCDLVLLAIAD
jgi:hypothetical protein